MKISFDLKYINNIVKKEFVSRMDKCKIFTFKGPLGAGKTTIIKNILKEVGVNEVVTSPTFAYVNSYKTSNGKVYHHFDLYRLDNIDSFLNLGFDEYLNDANNYCFIEWPEIIEPILKNINSKKPVCSVLLAFDPANIEKRFVEFN